MRFTVHDVGLGQFITLLHEGGRAYFWDAGSSNEFSPSDFCRNERISEVHKFVITNFDQDHVSGLPDLRKSAKIKILLRNKKADAAYIRRLKLEGGPITEAMESALQMHESYNQPVNDRDRAEPSNLSITTYSCGPSERIADTNNLSLVSVLVCNGFKVVICGDIEREGWDELIRTTSVLEGVSETSVFVASHHGREDGYHSAVLDAASPSCVVMSDYEVKHATQKSLDLYRKHCSGVQLNGKTRRVLTTRRDGTLTWNF